MPSASYDGPATPKSNASPAMIESPNALAWAFVVTYPPARTVSSPKGAMSLSDMFTWVFGTFRVSPGATKPAMRNSLPCQSAVERSCPENRSTSPDVEMVNVVASGTEAIEWVPSKGGPTQHIVT